MTTRIEIDLKTKVVKEIALTEEEILKATVSYNAWQIEEAARLAKKELEDARQAKFEEWLKTQK